MHYKINHINRSELWHYLGSQEDENLKQQIDAMEKLLLKEVQPRIIYKKFDLSIDELYKIRLISKDLYHLLKECHACIMMGATIGIRVDRLIERMQKQDMGNAIILDAMANTCIEQVCDAWQNDIGIQLSHQNLYITDRFSCGYGDLSIQYQEDFVHYLNLSKSIGVSINDSHMLVPCKSVTAILGISHHIQPTMIRGCDVCALKEKCQLRRVGKTCGKN